MFRLRNYCFLVYLYYTIAFSSIFQLNRWYVLDKGSNKWEHHPVGKVMEILGELDIVSRLIDK